MKRRLRSPNARRVAFTGTLCVALAIVFGGPQLAPLRAQPILTPPTREPTPDPNRSLPPLPFLNSGSAYTAPPKDPLSYDDAAMHFRPPDGWSKLAIPPAAEEGSTDLRPVAVFTRVRNKNDASLIIISTEETDQDLGAFTSEQESSARQGTDTVFIGFHKKITLSNGMPAIFEKINTTPAQGAQQSTRFEYLIVDGRRGIVVSYSDRNGDPDEKTVQAALASLTVVVYPHNRAQ